MKVAVGMSGGVDSTIAAALLQEAGHEVVGLTAHLWRGGSRCCSIEDTVRARKAAARLGIDHLVIELTDLFDRMIVEPFLDEYQRGRTPSPCARCNPIVKFGALLGVAARLGCSHVATGHYAQVVEREGRLVVRRGVDRRKDQSYFLHRLLPEQLARALFPLGGMQKAEVLEEARRRDLPVPSSGESQDLCFVTDGDYAAFLENRRPAARHEGRMVDTTGREVGRHGGVHRFTVGQREGLGVAVGAPRYVRSLDAARNEVVIGDRSEVMAAGCVVEAINWLLDRAGPFECGVQLRYRHAPAAARVIPLENGRAMVHFKESQFAVTPGQAAVFYDGDDVVGGGWIGTPDWNADHGR